jgi:hypothetical protein
MEINIEGKTKAARELAERMAEEARAKGSRASFSVQIGTRRARKTVYVRKEQPDGEIILYPVTEQNIGEVN